MYVTCNMNNTMNVKEHTTKPGSGEIPWEDFKLIIKESISRGQLNNT